MRCVLDGREGASKTLVNGFDSHTAHQKILIDMDKTLEERIIDLHDIARQIEKEIGKGQLSEDIRQAADRLSELLKSV